MFLIDKTEEVLKKSNDLKLRIQNNSIKKYEVSNAVETLESSLKTLTPDVIKFWYVTLKVAFLFLLIFVFSSLVVLNFYTNLFTQILCLFSGIECIILLKQCYISRKNTSQALQNFRDILKSLR